MVNVTGSRIAHTQIGNPNAPSFDEIAGVAARSKGEGSIRAKSDGTGGTIVYGHKSSLRSLFNRAYPERKDAGARMLKASLQEYVKNKSPKAQEHVRYFLNRHFDGNAVKSHVTNQEIVQLKADLDKLTKQEVGVSDVASRLKNDPSQCVAIFGDHLDTIARPIGEAFARRYREDFEDKIGNVPAPEVAAGFALAILKHIKDGQPVSKDLEKALIGMHREDSESESRLSRGISDAFREYEQTGNNAVLLDKLSDIVKGRWFSATSSRDPYMGDHDRIYSANANNIRAPLYLTNPQAQASLQDFGTSGPGEKLDKLLNAFTAHLAAPNMDGDYGGLIFNNEEDTFRHRLDNVRRFDTAGESLAYGFDNLVIALELDT